MILLSHLNKLNRPFRILFEIFLIGVIGFIDYFTGFEYVFSFFYVIPITFASWYINRSFAVLASLVGALFCYREDIASGLYFSNPIIPLWNTLIRISFFILIALILSKLKFVLHREQQYARTDYLTGALNSRHFYELLQMESDRLQRYEHPFTLAYIDIDNFKDMNDTYGHMTGDEALRSVVSYIRRHSRKTDIIARLGGDEFALLLPETNEDNAKEVLSKLHAGLLDTMRKNNWPMTFSIGALTCRTAMLDSDVFLKKADELMYQVKRSSKNAINYSTF